MIALGDVAHERRSPGRHPSPSSRRTPRSCRVEQRLRPLAIRCSTRSRSSVPEISRPTSARAAISSARRLRLLVQPRVLDRRPDVGGDRRTAGGRRPRRSGLSRSVLWTLITPIASSPTMDRHPEVRLGRRADPTNADCASKCSSRLRSRGSPDGDDPRRQALAHGHRRLIETTVDLAVVRECDLPRRPDRAARRRRCRRRRSTRARSPDELDQGGQVELAGRRLVPTG